MTLIQYLHSQFTPVQVLDFAGRLLLACLCGAAIGYERSKRFKEAGIRTHIIVCCASALFMLVSKYGLADMITADGAFSYGTHGTDPARVAAQVVSGISFLCAGVIFKNEGLVKGLTTAAGLWATGIVGLSIGAGFYEGALAGTIAILFCEIVMSRFRFRRYKTFHCVINYLHKDTLDHILRHCKDLHFAIKGLQIEGEADDSGEKVYSAFVALRPYKEIDYDAFIREVEGFDGVINAFVQ